MNSENKRLKETLDQVTKSYGDLQMHLMRLMQQKRDNINNNQRGEISCVELENDPSAKNNTGGGGRRNGGGGGQIVPGQFMDLSLGAPGTATVAASAVKDEMADENSSVGGRDRSLSPPVAGNNIEGSNSGGDHSPEKSSNWVSNKVSRLNHASKTVDQTTEATMRKARVSVRALSESVMVIHIHIFLITILFKMKYL